MRTYETVFVMKPDLSADDQTKHLEFYKDNIVKNGGEILKVEVWGKQTLAYPIENLTEGFYILIQFNAESGYTDSELEKRFKFNEDVIRFVVVMIDEKKFKLNPRKEPVRRERPAGDKGTYRPRKSEDDAESESSEGENVEVSDNDSVDTDAPSSDDDNK